MTPIHFVIPAAGCAARFQGTLKELLPISELDCGLTYAVRLAHRLGGIPPVVVTTQEKYDAHTEAIRSAGLLSNFIVKGDPEQGDMWGSVQLAIDMDQDNGIILPDTVADVGIPVTVAHGMTFGCFLTKESRRFSCLDLSDIRQAKIRTKQLGSESLAWGIALWDQGSNALLKSHNDHYDRAFEAVMQQRGFGLFLLKSYHDLGSFEHYWDYLNAHRNSGHLA